jgi:type IV pilus assembly protein PilC
MEAAGQDELLGKLRLMGIMPTKIASASSAMTLEPFFERFQRVSFDEMIMFIVQLSHLIGSGIPIVNSLQSLHQQISNKKFKDIVGQLVRSVESGESFSGALARYPHIFPSIFVNMVKAGEASGKLEAILARYASFSEEQADIQQKIKGALFYPVILLCAGVAVILFIVTFVIPQFAGIFLKGGVKLPLPTVILYHVGLGIKHGWAVFLIGFAALVLGVRHIVSTPKGRYGLDRLKLRLPVIGPVYRKAAVSRLTRTLGILLGSGVPVLQALVIVKEVIGNVVLAQLVEEVRLAAERGERLTEPLKSSAVFPPDAVQMIAVGEETGNLDGMLNKIADFYDMSVGHSIKKLTALIEPIFLVIIGSMVGFIMASMLLPIFDMMKILRR